ncbi:MAG: histidinol-phosphate transaminase [Candidatus Omnitrophota bacterium]|nr:MAG: histidinol-phosphate transaminase [Candidatus Omnitrophota bacterium]
MKIYRKELEKLKVYKPGKPIEEVKRELGLKEVYKLASNEIPFSPLYLRDALTRELKNVSRYPESNCFYLRKVLAKKLKVCGEQIVFGNGSDEVITLALRAFIERGEEVIVSYPTFLIYEIQARIEGAKIRRVPLKDFRYDLDAIARKVTRKTKIIFIANPDNPTGTYLAHKEVEGFLRKIPKRVLVYFDEAYFEFAPNDFPRTAALLKKRGNIIFTRTFSKAYGLAGLRIGYGVASLEVAGILNKVREPFNINRFAQCAALNALQNKNFLKKIISYTQNEKRYLYRQLQVLDISFIKSATNFILVNFKKDTRSLYEYLLGQGIIVRELRSWGLKDFFRVTVGTHKENVKFIQKLAYYLKNS